MKTEPPSRLRIYHHNVPENLRLLIDEAVAASWCTCERCGSIEGITTNLKGYRLTLCPDCRKGIKPRVTLKTKIQFHCTTNFSESFNIF